MEINFPPRGLQVTNIKVLQKPTFVRSSPLFANSFGSHRRFPFHLVDCSNFVRSKKLRGHILKVACAASFDHFFEEELSKQIEENAQLIGVTDCVDNSGNESFCPGSEKYGNLRFKDGKKGTETDFSMQLLPSKLEYLEPHLLGIQLDLSDWPERNEIASITIEKKANSVDIPLSLRMIKRKQKWQEGFVDAGEFACCSVKKAFSSLVFMIRELQNHALQIRESLYSEDLREVMNKVQKEINSTFVWMFRQVFSRTPTLMVYVMILLANFTVNSMAENARLAAIPSPGLSYATIGETTSSEEGIKEQSGSDSSTSFDHPRVSLNAVQEHSLHHEMTAEEVSLWKSVLEEALRIRADSRYKVLDNHIMQQLVSPITVKPEPDDCEQYSRTDLLYQMGILKEPNNALLLLNYAQFLCLVAKDFDRAEECYKRAIEVQPPDAEALSQYADFLWRVRDDLWGAEERYEQAISAEPENSYHASKYANFLWNTGGEETCFPLGST